MNGRLNGIFMFFLVGWGKLPKRYTMQLGEEQVHGDREDGGAPYDLVRQPDGGRVGKVVGTHRCSPPPEASAEYHLW
jgi:hypothetical protein